LNYVSSELATLKALFGFMPNWFKVGVPVDVEKSVLEKEMNQQLINFDTVSRLVQQSILVGLHDPTVEEHPPRVAVSMQTVGELLTLRVLSFDKSLGAGKRDAASLAATLLVRLSESYPDAEVVLSRHYAPQHNSIVLALVPRFLLKRRLKDYALGEYVDVNSMSDKQFLAAWLLNGCFDVAINLATGESHGV
jgi:hypothetical protein